MVAFTHVLRCAARVVTLVVFLLSR